MVSVDTDLLIVGAGAAGLMAAVRAGELGLRVALVERKHQPGRKLLMCGNNRCNITHNASPARLPELYGDPVGPFLAPALEAFPPASLRRWFSERGLQTTVHKDGRVFPHSEKADDVLHVFTDFLRDRSIPIVCNCPVTGVSPAGGRLRVTSESLAFSCRNLLLATGGVSYPKTGSVGDGQRFARKLGHKVMPYRPGLAGYDLAEKWLNPKNDVSLPATRIRLLAEGGECVGETVGEILLTRRGARGPAMVNASRIVSRLGLKKCRLDVDLWPTLEQGELVARLRTRRDRRGGKDLAALVGNAFLPPALCTSFLGEACRLNPSLTGGAVTDEVLATVSRRLKSWSLQPRGMRSLKEAMVTVGGVALTDVDPGTMESRRCPGLYFAGEMLDIDGPTGGFNLQAAFATAYLAVTSLAKSTAEGRKRPPADH